MKFTVITKTPNETKLKQDVQEEKGETGRRQASEWGRGQKKAVLYTCMKML